MPKSAANNIVIIGGGFSGLASAALLSRAGWQVTVLEKNRSLGGRARVARKKGFAFDMGPSWYLMPEVFEQFFAQFGKSSRDYYRLQRLEPRYQVIFSDGEKVKLRNDLRQNQAWFESKVPGAGKQLAEFLSNMKEVYAAATTKLMYEDIWNWRSLITLDNLRSFWTLVTRLQFWRNWSEVLQIFKHEKLQQVLGFPAVFLGGSPFNTPALFSILAWADFGQGVWYPMGGMGKVVQALVDLATQQGAVLKTKTEATAIQVEEGRVAGVHAGDVYYPADIVIGAADMPFIETKLLPKKYQTWPKSYWAKKELGISALMLYLGINKRLPRSVHHTIYFSRDWQKNFDDIFKTKVLPDDPSLYISLRSATDRTIVPPGNEEIVVLVPLGCSTYSQVELQKFTDKIIDKLENVLKTDIRQHLVVKEMYTPRDFQQDYHAYQGTALGLAHTLTQSLWFRPDNRSQKVKNLFYVGQYTNPGVGVPMALISAQIVAKLIGRGSSSNDEIFRRGSTTYYYSSLFFQGQVKRDVFTLYSYVRVADDFVDHLPPLPEEFETMWQETRRAWQGQSSRNPIVQDFVELAQRQKFEWEWIEAFWSAMRSDLHKKKYHNFAELEKYMYGSAEVIGLMMAQILKLPPVAQRAAAIQGKAMQLLNFIRDVSEDETLGRNYLGYTTAQRHDPEQWQTFLRSMIQTYRQLQKEAAYGYQYIPKPYLIPIKTAADMYSWTADALFQNPALVWHKKLKPRKIRVVLQALKNMVWLS